MTTDNTPCGIAIPQDFIDRPINMPLIRTYVQRAEALPYDSLFASSRPIKPGRRLSWLHQQCSNMANTLVTWMRKLWDLTARRASYPFGV